MAGLSSVTNFFKNNNVISKTIGIATLGAIAWDTHKNALMESDIYAKNRDAQACLYYTNNAMQQNSLCRITEKIKEKALKDELDCGWRRFFNLGIGYVKGAATNLTDHWLTLGLGAATLLTKGLPAKISAGTLVVYGGFKAIKDYFGIGNPKNPFKIKN